MSNVATKWYYEGHDECSFESPQAPGATQVRNSFHRETRVDHTQALSGPTGIGRRRLNDGKAVIDSKAPATTAVYTYRPSYINQSTEDAVASSDQDIMQTQSEIAADALTRRLRQENLILQHTADQGSFRERQRNMLTHMKAKLEQEQMLRGSGCSSECGVGIVEPRCEAGIGHPSKSSSADRVASPLDGRVADINERHAKLLKLRGLRSDE